MRPDRNIADKLYSVPGKYLLILWIFKDIINFRSLTAPDITVSETVTE